MVRKYVYYRGLPWYRLNVGQSPPSLSKYSMLCYFQLLLLLVLLVLVLLLPGFELS
jgi:hypothetical protein